MTTPEKLGERLHQRNFYLWTLSLFALHMLLMLLFAVYRFVDFDEGFYLQAGRSVAHGLRLYTDIFYPQAPLYPQVLALLPISGWEYWLQARFLSVFFSVLTMALVGLSVKNLVLLSRETVLAKAQDSSSQTYIPILMALALYSLSGLFLAWNSTAKPLALSQFFLMAGVFSYLVSYTESATKRKFFWVFISGVSLALAFQTRSPMLVAWGITLLSVLIGSTWKQKATRAGWFLAGSIIAALPAIVMAVNDSSRFYFNNFGFHLMRTETPSLIQILSDKLNFLTRTTLDPQLAIMLLLTVIIIVGIRKSPKSEQPKFINYYPLAIGLALIGSYLMAYPAHRQYVTQGLPVIIVFAAAHSNLLVNWLGNLDSRFSGKFPVVVITVYLLTLAPYSWVYLTTARERDKRCDQSRVVKIVTVIEQHSALGDTILAEVPIYAVLANRPQTRRAEFYGFEYKSLALGKNYADMNLADSTYIANLVTAQKVKLVIVENFPDSGLAEALAGRYQKIYDDSFSQIWQVNSK